MNIFAADNVMNQTEERWINIVINKLSFCGLDWKKAADSFLTSALGMLSYMYSCHADIMRKYYCLWSPDFSIKTIGNTTGVTDRLITR